jgi:predicted AAA+ superfamily ATPase
MNKINYKVELVGITKDKDYLLFLTRNTMKEIKRDIYLNRLIDRCENGSIKVITGVRRCGKSYLLFHLYKNYLIEQGTDESNIVEIPLDDDFEEYRDRKKLS